MSTEVRQDQPNRSIAQAMHRCSADEDRAWAAVYAAINKPSTSEEVIRQLDADPQSKRDHLALYIMAKATLRQRKLTHARVRGVATIARLTLHVVIVAPARLIAGEYTMIRDSLLAALPAIHPEPAAVRASLSRSEPASSAANDLFGMASSDTADLPITKPRKAA